MSKNKDSLKNSTYIDGDTYVSYPTGKVGIKYKSRLIKHSEYQRRLKQSQKSRSNLDKTSMPKDLMYIMQPFILLWVGLLGIGAIKNKAD